VVRPFDDQLRWGSHDYLSANRWVDVSSPAFGVSMAPWNEQIFEFGEIRYNQFSVDYKPSNSHLFAYAWSNRMTGLLDLGQKNPEFTVGYTLTSHAGDWNTGAAAHLGWTVASPLKAEEIPKGSQARLDAHESSFFSIDVPNVEMTVLKESEQPGRGWIVRLVEMAGKATDAVLTSSLLPVKEAWACDLVEDNETALPVDGDHVRVHLLPFGTATVRLLASQPPAGVQELAAHAVSGEQVALTWTGAAGSDFNVYRSTDPEDPPTAYTLLVRTSTDRFTDDHLMPMTNYTYRVAAVNRDNRQGPDSAPVTATTLAVNREPPPPATGLTVIMLTGGRRMVAWPKSTATDVAEYIVYRSQGSVFNPRTMQKIVTQKPSGFSIETYIDGETDSDKPYSYFVLPVDWAGNRPQMP
jgi:hypothetical protein